MIFLTVGNWHKGYDRLVEAVDMLKACDLISDEVIAQVGSGSYRPSNLQEIDYCAPSEFVDIMARSRVVITHAGIGTIGQAIELSKPAIVVPRKAELGECSDNHQWTTAKELEEEGKILVANEVSELPDKLKQAKNFVPAKRQSGEKIIEAIEKFLRKLEVNKCCDSNNE